MSYVIVPATRGHVMMLRENLRPADRLELAGLGLSVRKGVWRSFAESLWASAVFVDGEIAAIWGLGAESTLGDVGYAWLLTTGAIERIPLAFVREGRREIAKMLEVYPQLKVWVQQSYSKACRFVGLLGFEVQRTEESAYGSQYVLFVKER